MTTTPQKIDWTPIFKYLDDNFATKQDVKKIVQDEANIWLTKIDNQIALSRLTDIAIKKTNTIMATKQDIINLREELVKRFSHLPTKEQFYKKMDKWMKATTTHDLEKSAHKHAHDRISEHLASSNIL